jgi:hypothetical protein
MTFSPIDNWTPVLDHERDLFFNVYIDETSQTKFRYLIIGGLVVPLSHALLFENEIIAARAGTITPAVEDNGTVRVMKWHQSQLYRNDFFTFMLRPKPLRRPNPWLVGKPGYWA